MTDTIHFSGVLELRDKAGIDVFTAKKIVRGEELRADLARAENLEDLRAVLKAVLDDKYLHPPEGFVYVV